MNVIDAFAPRDLAQEGRGRPLSPIPTWMLLHDLQKSRVLVRCGRRTQLTWLPASRDASGGARVKCTVVAGGAEQIVQAIAERLPGGSCVDELLLGGRVASPVWVAELSAKIPTIRVVPLENLKVIADRLSRRDRRHPGPIAPGSDAGQRDGNHRRPHAARARSPDPRLAGQLASPDSRTGRRPAQRRHPPQRGVTITNPRPLVGEECFYGMPSCPRDVLHSSRTALRTRSASK